VVSFVARGFRSGAARALPALFGSFKRCAGMKSLKHVVILGEAGLTTSALNLLGRADVRVTVLDWYGNVTGTYEPAGSPSAGAVSEVVPFSRTVWRLSYA